MWLATIKTINALLSFAILDSDTPLIVSVEILPSRIAALE
jgi:hypothetical protein